MQVKLRGNETQGVQTSTQAQDKAQESRRQKALEKQQKKNVIFAGELPFHKDPVTLRRQEAQRKAMEFVKNAWNGDRKTDQSIDEINALTEKKREELQLNQDKVAECRARKENLRERYGVEADSREQKDLELLERSYYPGENDAAFTEEEEQRLRELRDPSGESLTEYQQKCLEIDGEERVFRSRAQSAEDIILAYSETVTNMKLEQLKFHKMTDARENAKKVMEQAGEEIQNMIVDEAKDHVDETFEEQREEAKEKAEEKEEQEEKIELRQKQKELLEKRIEAIREDSNEAEAAQKKQERDAREEAELLSDMADAGLNVAGAGDAVKAEIIDLLNKLKLIEADIKGIEVDEEI